MRSKAIEAVSLDLGPAFIKSVTTECHAPQAVICADPFHVVKIVGDALDEIRRDLWQGLRRLPDLRHAKDFKGARSALLKNPEDLTDRQAAELPKLRRAYGFHSPDAALALVILGTGPINLQLPHEQRTAQTAR